MAGVTLAASAAIAVAPLTVTTRPGIDMPRIGTVSSGPTAIAIRYEGSGLVRPNSTRFVRPLLRSCATGVLLTARSAAGPGSVTLHRILNSGSAQPGTAPHGSGSS